MKKREARSLTTKGNERRSDMATKLGMIDLTAEDEEVLLKLEESWLTPPESVVESGLGPERDWDADWSWKWTKEKPYAGDKGYRIDAYEKYGPHNYGIDWGPEPFDINRECEKVLWRWKQEFDGKTTIEYMDAVTNTKSEWKRRYRAVDEEGNVLDEIDVAQIDDTE